MRKRLFLRASALLIILCFCLASCTNGGAPKPTQEAITPTEAPAPTAAPTEEPEEKDDDYDELF